MNSFKRFILWDYRRGSVQYDIMVGLILAFLFLTPREWFKDQPKASSVSILQTAHGTEAFWIDSDVLNGIPASEQLARASQVVKTRTGRKETVVRLQAILDSEQEPKGYLAYTTP